jgi:hypothetical protein
MSDVAVAVRNEQRINRQSRVSRDEPHLGDMTAAATAAVNASAIRNTEVVIAV